MGYCAVQEVGRNEACNEALVEPNSGSDELMSLPTGDRLMFHLALVTRRLLHQLLHRSDPNPPQSRVTQMFMYTLHLTGEEIVWM